MRTPLRCLSCFVVLAAASLPAQELRRQSYGHLAGLRGVYDPVRERVVVPDSGGYSLEWDGNVWSRLPDLGSVAGFPYIESGSGRLVVVREWSGSPLRFNTRTGHEWQTATVPGGPVGSSEVTHAYDSFRGELLWFGQPPGLGTSAETWTFDGVSWQLHAVTGPSERHGAVACFDSVRQRVVLFGGANLGVHMGDTWEWDGANWTQVTTAVSPPARWNASMAFDSARGVVVMGGGVGAANASLADLWEFDGTSWLQRQSLTVPSAGRLGSFVYDEARAETLVLGLSGSAGSSGAVHAWDGSQWHVRSGLGQFQWSNHSMISPDHTGSYVLQLFEEATSPSTWSQQLFGWDGSDWQALSTGGIPARSRAAMWPMTNGTFVFGGQDRSGVDLGDTWRWDGFAWGQVASAVSPAPRQGTAAVFHASQGHALLFGGYASGSLAADTWRFDGTNWQQLVSGPQPGARVGHVMAYDPVRDRVVLYGGLRMGNFGVWYPWGDTWEHDGTGWTLVMQNSGLPFSSTGSHASIAYDSGRQAIVAVTVDVGGPQLFEYTGSAWLPLPVVGGVGSAHILHGVQGLACTGNDGRLVVVASGYVSEMLSDPSGAESYGQTCTALAPSLLASELPDIGRANFALHVTSAPSNGLVAIAGADQPANLPVAGCTMLVQPGVASALLVANANGFAQLPMPLPANQALLGADFYFQAGALDSTAPAGITMSRGLRITLGE